MSLEDFVQELLSESVTLRAWEILERKQHMKGPTPGNSHSHNRRQVNGNTQSYATSANRGKNAGGRGGYAGKKGQNHQRYQNIMDDKAAFLEYVRNQEKGRT